MSTGLTESASNGNGKPSSSVEQQAKVHSLSVEQQAKVHAGVSVGSHFNRCLVQSYMINEVRGSLGPLPDSLLVYCSDASISRYLKARNWNVKKAVKMLKATLKWRLEYKPEEIRWEAIASEAETGKIYRLDHNDKYGRAVLVMRPSRQNTKSTKGQIRYLVYCMENAILNLPAGQEQMVWLIDFHGFNMSNISVKVTRETSIVLQEHYPERLGLAILYNPPKFFESFWMIAKPFLEPKTQKKVNFVYSDDPNTKNIMENLFDMDKLESSFGGNNQMGFSINKYAERMREDDKRMPSFWARDKTPSIAAQPTPPTVPCFDSVNSESDSDDTDKEKAGNTSSQEVASEQVLPKNSLPEARGSANKEVEVMHSGEGTTKPGFDLIEAMSQW